MNKTGLDGDNRKGRQWLRPSQTHRGGKELQVCMDFVHFGLTERERERGGLEGRHNVDIIDQFWVTRSTLLDT